MVRQTIVLVGIVIGVAVPSPTFGAKADGPKARARIYAQFDKNGNRVLDPDEREAIRKAFEVEKQAELKWFDRDQDGKLSEAELDLIKPPPVEGVQKTEANKSEEKQHKPAGTPTASGAVTNAPGPSKSEMGVK